MFYCIEKFYTEKCACFFPVLLNLEHRTKPSIFCKCLIQKACHLKVYYCRVDAYPIEVKMFFKNGGGQGNIRHPGEEIISESTLVHNFFFSFLLCVGVAGVEHGSDTNTEEALVVKSMSTLFLIIISF